MKKILLILFLMLLPSSARAGLTYYTYYCPTWPCTQQGVALSTGTLSSYINYNWGGGYVLDSGRYDYVSVKVQGYITIPGTGTKTVTFYSNNDDGSQIIVNGTTVVDDWSGLHPAAYRSGSIQLTGGQSYSFTAWFSEWGGGAVFQLLWLVDGSFRLIEPEYFTVTAPGGGGGGGYTSNITNEQQTRITANRTATDSLPTANEVYIAQVGDNNTVTINQTGTNKITGTNTQNALISGNSNTITMNQNSGTGKNKIDFNLSSNSNTVNLNQGHTSNGTISANELGGHYQKVDVQGIGNSLTTSQTRTVGTTGNYMEQSITGNYNSITSTQTGDGKLLFNSITGNLNTVNTTQAGTGASHYIDLTLNGNGHTATVNQSGTTQNKATIVLNNLGGGAGINLTQTGGQTYNITTNCVQSNGCGTTTVTQGQ